jgi:Tfp pilus assembly PilM family ATPase
MSRLLALEWDTREARLVVGRTVGRSLTVEAAFAVALDSSQGESLREQLAATVASRGLGRGEWLVAVPRSRTELRVLQVPPVPDDELPDVVRFQAVRQFSALAEDAPLDFVRLDGVQASQVRVLAASLAPQVLDDVRAQCTACHGTPQRLVLRPFASASLFRRSNQDPQCRLLVEMLAEEADLTVLVRGQAVLVRSVRLPSDDPATPLVGEIRRTIVAAQNQVGEETVRVVTLVGDPQRLAPLQSKLSEQLGLQIDVFDPFAAVKVAPENMPALPEHRGRYAALLGMLCDEAEGKPHGIDFLNPRRRPTQANQRVRYAVLGGVAATCAIVLLVMITTYMGRLDANLQGLRTRSRELDDQVKMAQKVKADVAEIDKFVVGDVNWLDELYRMSAVAPSAKDAIVEQASFNSIPSGGGQILLEGYVRTPDVIRVLEEALRSPQHQVTGTGAQRVDRRQDLPWEFKERINVLPPDLENLSAADLIEEADPSDPSDQSDQSDQSDPSDPSDQSDQPDQSDQSEVTSNDQA